ncbi:response regulator [Halomicrobium katesii]|uniref:response regulator n=1 Tax=Halomicrobium katesii TaxID=437163 RepID=UPI0003800CDF|nr:response regulator [Halomicrobium katesii]
MASVGDGGGNARAIDVLVVDDEPQMAELVGTYLERTGDDLQVATATSVGQGLDALDDRFDCVVSDYHMPQMDGLTFLERVRERVPDAVRILYTSDGDAELMIEARDAEVDYVHKQVSTKQYAAMATHIRRRTAADSV